MLNAINLIMRQARASRKIFPGLPRLCEVSSMDSHGNIHNFVYSKNCDTLFGNQTIFFIPKQRFCSQSEVEESATSFHVQDYEDFRLRVLNSDRPIVVDFFADWCGPCKLLAPRLESLVDNKGGEVLLAKVNVDDCSEVAMEYGVRSVPTVIGFRDGQPVEQFVGLTEDEQINSFLNRLTNS